MLATTPLDSKKAELPEIDEESSPKPEKKESAYFGVNKLTKSKKEAG